MTRSSFPVSRRSFLQTGLGIASVSYAAPSRLLAGLSGIVAPSNRITMALIGCGGMGNSNLRSFMRKSDVQIVAVCDPDRERMKASQAEVSTHYAGATRDGTWSGCEAYTDFREVIARDDIDAVIVGSPDHWHALHTVLAVRSGKDVYGEKPLSLTIGQGRTMSDEVARYSRVFQTGSQQRSDARFRRACELIRNGRLGTIYLVTCGLPAGSETGNHPPIPVPEGFDYDLWLGPAPYEPYCENRTHYNFRHILDYSGGKLTDWGAHHIDIAQWALGTTTSGPIRIGGNATYPQDGLWNAPLEYDIEAEYENGVRLRITSNAPNGVLFEGDRGRLFITRGDIRCEPSSILQEEISASEDRLPVSTDHHRNFLECVKSRDEPIAPIEHAHRSISIAHLGNISMQLGRSVQWDPATETVIGDESAARMLDRPMRTVDVLTSCSLAEGSKPGPEGT